MAIRLHNTLTRDQGGVRTARPGQGRDVRLRPDGLQRHPHRQRPHVPRPSTSSAATSIYRGFEVDFVQNITDVDDKIINRANEEGVSAAEVARDVHRGVPQGDARPRRDGADAPARRRPRDPRDDRDDRAAHRARPRVRGRRRRLLLGAQLPRLRQALRPRHRRPRVRRARRRRRAQARPARLRAVEVRQAGRAALAEPVGRGPPGLAPRVLGDVGEVPRHARSTSTAAARTSSSRTTRTRSRSPRRRRASRSPATGCTAACCRSTPRR